MDFYTDLVSSRCEKLQAPSYLNLTLSMYELNLNSSRDHNGPIYAPMLMNGIVLFSSASSYPIFPNITASSLAGHLKGSLLTSSSSARLQGHVDSPIS